MKKVQFDPVQKVTQLLEAQHALDASKKDSTLGIVMGTKVREYLASTSLSTIAFRLFQAFCLAVVAVALLMGWDIAQTFVSIFVWHHGFFPGLWLAWVVLFRFRAVLSTVKGWWTWLRENADCPWPDFIRSVIAHWMGIPLPGTTSGDPASEFGGLKRVELLAFLRTRRHLNSSQYMDTYPKTRKNDVTRVSKGLLAAGVLVKGDNNANVLTEALEWEQVENLIASAMTPEELANQKDEPIRIRVMRHKVAHAENCICMECRKL